jgi:hypothetical protein
LSNVGAEMSYQLPIAAASKFVPMLNRLDDEITKGAVSSYGISITTLEEVFLMVEQGHTPDNKNTFASKHVRSDTTGIADDPDNSVRSRMDLENESLFLRHLGALFKNIAAFFRRDKKAWCWYVL